MDTYFIDTKILTIVFKVMVSIATQPIGIRGNSKLEFYHEYDVWCTIVLIDFDQLICPFFQDFV